MKKHESEFQCPKCQKIVPKDKMKEHRDKCKNKRPQRKRNPDVVTIDLEE